MEFVRAIKLGWQTLKNGEQLKAAEDNHFEAMVTADRNLSYQQKLTGRELVIVVLPSGQWPNLKPRVDEIADVIGKAKPGSFLEIGLQR